MLFKLWFVLKRVESSSSLGSRATFFDVEYDAEGTSNPISRPRRGHVAGDFSYISSNARCSYCMQTSG